VLTITAGLGFKLQHFAEALTARADGLWFEVHAENYMVDGGPRLAALLALRERHAVSLHGVGLSIVSADPPNSDHLRRLKLLAERVSPAVMSDHLAWQRWGGMHISDFLPFPRTREALELAADNLSRIQDSLGRQLLVENPSLYVDVSSHEMPELEFLIELAALSGCGLLVDVNNVFVSASNLGFSAEGYIDALPPELVGEIHLAGHSPDSDPDSPLIIDSHSAPVSDPVWRLFQRLVGRIGARPTLIERDGNIPAFTDLMVERARVHALIRATESAYV
jgi:uncharacterized protein (UPF0276 family)